MPRFRKDVLTPARYSVPDETGRERRTVVFTDADVRHLARRYDEMKAAGLHVPLCWEHQDVAKPAAERLADKARLIFGYAESAGIEGKTLGFELDVPDEAEAKRAETVRYVSPEIVHDWIDGSGKLWPGPSITHIAVTGKPVQHDQQPFKRLSVVRLSLADRLGDNVADDKKPDKKDDKAGDGGGDKADIKKVLEALKALGVDMPGDTTMENLTDRLIGAAAAKGGMPDAPKKPDVPAPVDGGNDAMMLSLQRKNASLEKAVLDSERAGQEQRVKALLASGRVTKPIHDSLLASLKTVQLSLADDGKAAPTAISAKIEAYEALPAGTTYPTDRLSQATEVPPGPNDPRRPPQSAREVDAIVADMDKATGRK